MGNYLFNLVDAILLVYIKIVYLYFSSLSFYQGYVYPTRKQSLIEDARRESTRSSLDISSMSFLLSSPEEKDDVFDDSAFEPVQENIIRRFTVTFSSKGDAGFGSLSDALRVFQVRQQIKMSFLIRFKGEVQ